MMTIADEIQAVSENANKCVDYPIGDKLGTFMRQQDDSGKTNFVLSGVLIYAAAKIYGRKVDYLEQEIVGIAKNFEAFDASGENKPEKEMKKTRTKKFVIKDSVNIEKITFEEKPINVLTKIDINKTLAVPSKINRLQKMKEVFSKSKSKSGKVVIPKNLLFNNDFGLSNFGSTQIYDFDDNKEIVGSRRDFTSFSYFINNCTGELQSDMPSNQNPTNFDDFHVSNRDNLRLRPITPDNDRGAKGTIDGNFLRPLTPGGMNLSRPATPFSPTDWTNRPDTPLSPSFNEPLMHLDSPHGTDNLQPITQSTSDMPHLTSTESPKSPNNDLNSSINIDEGIEADDSDRTNMILEYQPFLRLMEKTSLPLIQHGGDLMPKVDPKLSLTTIDFNLPADIREEVADLKIKNIFMIPLKKLKHKCLFSLPHDEFNELKRQKRDQCKPLGVDVSIRQLKIFNPFDLMRHESGQDDDDDEEEFRGFTKEQQLEPMTAFKMPDTPLNRSQDLLRKSSNDSGLELEFSNRSFEVVNSANKSSLEAVESCFEQTPNTSGNNTTVNNFSRTNLNESLDDTDNNINISGGDSCYQSLESGEHSKIELSSFFRDIEARNRTIDESEEAEKDEEIDGASDERVQQMKQSAIHIAKWKEYLKPILAGSEARSKVDMHQYAQEMISKIGDLNNTMSLESITEEGKTPVYFLTMLQLINNRNVEIKISARTMKEPVDMKNIAITLKSKLLHQEKFNEMGDYLNAEKEVQAKSITNLKRKAVQTSTPAKSKRLTLNNIGESSMSFISANNSQSMMDEEMDVDDPNIYSQATSGYCSQSSVFSDF